jgi:hypothetical protein
MLRKFMMIPFFVVVLFLIGFMFVIKGCLTFQNTYGAVGTPVISSDGRLVVMLIAESEATNYQENGGYRKTTYHTSYWLKSYDAQTGKLLKKKKIVSAAEKQNMTPIAYGGFGDNIWLSVDKIKAYNINTLEESINEKTIIEKNQFDAGIFPYEERFINEAVATGFIYFTATTGDRYRLNLSDIKITALSDESKADQEEFIRNMHFKYEKDGLSGTRCDTLNQNVLILSKDMESAEDSSPENSQVYPVYKKLYLFKADYTVRPLGDHLTYDYTNLVKTGDSSYINGFFLKDSKTGKTAKPTKKNTYLVVHHENISSNAKTILTAIDDNNKIFWSTNTGLSTKVETAIIKDHLCVLVGNKDPLAGSFIGNDMVCLVDMENGKLINIKVSD